MVRRSVSALEVAFVGTITWFFMIMMMIANSAAATTSSKIAVCPVAGTITNTMILDTSDPVMEYTELSGTAISYTQTTSSGAPILYGIADNGSGPRLGVWDGSTGKRIMTLQIPDSNFDWESMAFGNCGEGTDQHCIYIGDVGDNAARTSVGTKSSRPTGVYRILKLQEPDITLYQQDDTLPSTSLKIVYFNYNDPSSPTPYADSESIFIDHTGWGQDGAVGDIYVVTKWNRDVAMSNNRIFKIPASAWTNSTSIATMYSPQAVGEYDQQNEDTGIMGRIWNRADMSPDGTVIALGNDFRTHLFLRCPGQSVAEVMASANTSECYNWENIVTGQVETIAFTANGNQTLIIPEGSNAPMQWTEMKYDEPTARMCPVPQYNQDGTCVDVNNPAMTFPNAWCDAAIAFYADRNLPSTTPLSSPTPVPTVATARTSPTANPTPLRGSSNSSSNSLVPTTEGNSSSSSFSPTPSDQDEFIATARPTPSNNGGNDSNFEKVTTFPTTGPIPESAAVSSTNPGSFLLYTTSTMLLGWSMMQV
jgi:hypothetical protein